MKQAFHRIFLAFMTCVALLMTIMCVCSQKAHASSLQFYHGIEGFHSATSFKSSENANSINLRSFGGHPFIGVRVHEYLSLEGGYIHHKASSELAIFQPNIIGLPGAPAYPAYRNSAYKATYTIHGPVMGFVLHTRQLESIPVRFYAGASIFMSDIKLKFERNRPEMNYAASHPVAPLLKRRLFTRLSVGCMYYVAPHIALRANMILLRPEKIDFSHYQSLIIKELRNFSHIGVGIHWEWK